MTNPTFRPGSRGLYLHARIAEITQRGSAARLDSEDLCELLLNLQAHHIELELQNEELRRAQDQLLHARDALANLYDGAPVGYVTTKPDGIILAVNLRFAAMRGEARESIVGRNLSALVEAEHRDTYYLHRQALQESGARQQCELRLLRPGAEPLWVALDSVTNHDAENGLHVRTAVSNIAERKRSESEHLLLLERLAQAQKLEAIGTLAGGIAHDMNNILSVVLLLATQVEAGLPAENPKRNEVRDIIAAATRGRRLTQDLLDFAHKQTRRREICNPSQVLRRLTGVLERTTTKRIEFRTVFESDVAQLECDPDQLQQALLNICMNSVDAIKDKGVIVMAAGNVLPGDDELTHHPGLAAAPYVRIDICDDGVGMSAETQMRAFDPFFTTKDVGRGTGLGLYMVYRTVMEMGGGIRLISQPGRGTTVRMLLPVSPATTTMPILELPRAPVPVPQATVLVVDDEPLVRSALVRVLNTLGYRTLVADGGATALAVYQANQGHVDAVLLDLSMPIMDGAECYARLKQLDQNVRVILCTGLAHSPEVQALCSKTEVAVVAKPCTPAELSVAIAACLSRPQSHRQPN